MLVLVLVLVLALVSVLVLVLVLGLGKPKITKKGRGCEASRRQAGDGDPYSQPVSPFMLFRSAICSSLHMVCAQ